MNSNDFENRLEELKKEHVSEEALAEAEKRKNVVRKKRQVDCIEHRLDTIQTAAIDIMIHADSKDVFERSVADAMLEVLEVIAAVSHSCVDVIRDEAKQFLPETVGD